MEITRDESEKRELARGGECVYLGNPAPSDRDATVNLAPFQINDIRAGVAMRFDCRKLEQRVTLDFCALCHLFKPLLEASGPLIVAVTTSNRSVDTKDRTERALEQAVAAAGIDALTFVTQWDMSPPRRGPFGSFLTAMTDAMSRDPNACGYLYLQDDVELDERAIVWILAALEAKRRFLVASPYKPPTATPARTDPDLERVGAFVNRGYGSAADDQADARENLASRPACSGRVACRAARL